MSKLKGPLFLIIAALIWGTAFVAQKMGNDVGAFAFLATRSYVGFIFIFAFILIKSKLQKPNTNVTNTENKKYIKYGAICGSVMFAAAAMQQLGMSVESSSTDAGKAGFLTALYIVIVPILGLFMKKKVPIIVWISVLIAGVGTYFLSVKDSFTIELGDIYVIICAVFFSFHIIVIDKFAPKTDPIKLSCTQFIVCAILSSVSSLIFENVTLAQISGALLPILYCGIMSSGVAYTLQIVGQKYTQPATASIIMSLESIFAVLAGVIVLGETLIPKEILGCIMVFIAVILAQTPDFLRKNQE